MAIEAPRSAHLDRDEAHRQVMAIVRAVAAEYDVTTADLLGRQRPSRLSRPRNVAMYLARRLTGASLPQIARVFDGRHHTTVMYAVDSVRIGMGHDNPHSNLAYALEQELRR